MSRREPTVSITVRFPKALAERLGERAKQDHQSVSTLLRRYAELGLNGEDYAQQTDPLRDIIREEIIHSVRQQTGRIAALLNRLVVGILLEETFAQYHVRYIAVNDGVDTINGIDDSIAVRDSFKNISHSGKVSNDFSLFGRF